jgi:hypothetical protein
MSLFMGTFRTLRDAKARGGISCRLKNGSRKRQAYSLFNRVIVLAPSIVSTEIATLSPGRTALNSRPSLTL